MSEVTLSEFVKSTEYNETSVVIVIKNLLKAVELRHNQGIYNSIINPDTVVIDCNYQIKLPRFDVSFAAPEIIRNLPTSNVAADIFSVGVCIFFACTKSNPFERAYTTTEENIINEEYEIDLRIVGYSTFIDNYKKLFLNDIIVGMLKYHPEQRSSIDEILKSPFFWDTNQMDELFQKNFYKIQNPKKYLNGLYLRRYDDLHNYKDTLELLKRFPTLPYDLCEQSLNK